MKWIGQTIYKFQKIQRNNSFHYDARDGFLQFEVILLHIIVQTGTVVVLKITIFSSTGWLKPQLQEPETEDQSTLFDGGLLIFIPFLLHWYTVPFALIPVHCTFNILTLMKWKRGVCSEKMFCRVAKRSKSIFKDFWNDTYIINFTLFSTWSLYQINVIHPGFVVSLTNVELKLFCLSYSLTHHCLSFCLLICLFVCFLYCFSQLTFKRPSNDRNLTFEMIAKEAQLPLEEVS